jgi:orotidine-5'-phosphate decarboxylase
MKQSGNFGDFKQGTWPIAVALDEPWSQSEQWVDRLQGKVWGFKVGSILFTEMGPSVVRRMRDQGFRVFLDLKFCDIPNTVAGAVKAAFALGVDVLTVHAVGGSTMLKEVARLQSDSQIAVAVTLLTSWDQPDLNELKLSFKVSDGVAHYADLAMKSGLKGLVSSVHEVALLRSQYPDAFLITPGIRMSESHDQKRVGTLEYALKAGSSLAVVGRALTAAQDWEKAWHDLTSFSDATFSKKH